MWVRGLKPVEQDLCARHRPVAPHVGAWIETQKCKSTLQVHLVAPHVGAWIETGEGRLKDEASTVAPHVGAWIETVRC